MSTVATLRRGDIGASNCSKTPRSDAVADTAKRRNTMKRRYLLTMLCVALSIGTLGLALATAQVERAGQRSDGSDGQDYGAAGPAEYQKVEGPKNLAAEKIDTTELPKPGKDYVDAIATSSSVGGSGGFF